MSRRTLTSTARGPGMFEKANKVGIQGGEFNNAGRDIHKFVISIGQDPVETLKTAIPVILEAIRVQSSVDRKTRIDRTENAHRAPPRGRSVIIDTVPLDPSPVPADRSIAERYTRSLLECLAGYPLFEPHPYSELSVKYVTKGVCVGDVGYVTRDGAFDFLFSIYPAQTNSVNPKDLPKGFTLKTSGDTKIERKNAFSSKTHLFQSPVSRKKSLFGCTKYTCSETWGAVLELPEGATQDKAVNTFPFRKLAARRGEQWYKYATRTRGRDVSNGSLYLITSSTKCTQWGIAVFNQPSSQRDGLRFVQANGLFHKPSSKYRWKGSGTITTKVAPTPNSNDEDGLNQCIFLEGFKVMLRQDIYDNIINGRLHEKPHKGKSASLPQARSPPREHRAQRIRGGAGPDPSPNPAWYASGHERKRPAAEGANFKQPQKPPDHPSDLVNAALLNQQPDARVALTHDDDWRELLQDLKSGHSVNFARISHPFTSTIDKYGCIYPERVSILNNNVIHLISQEPKYYSHPIPQETVYYSHPTSQETTYHSRPTHREFSVRPSREDSKRPSYNSRPSRDVQFDSYARDRHFREVPTISTDFYPPPRRPTARPPSPSVMANFPEPSITPDFYPPSPQPSPTHHMFYR